MTMKNEPVSFVISNPSAISFTTCLLCLILCSGCQWILPINVDTETSAYREPVDTTDGAIFYSEQGLDDGLWLEIERTHEPGVVGGYLSKKKDHRGALIMILPGASTFHFGGAEEKARVYHRSLAAAFREARYLTWSLAVRECGTAYGQGDLADVTEAVSWLERSGKAALGVERVYIVGYSNGATLAILVNRRLQVDALVSMSGITQPDQFEAMWSLYDAITQLFPNNTGICQMRSTLAYYGPPGSPAWDDLDSVNHLDEFLAPMLFVHGTEDIVFHAENTLSIQNRYQEMVASGEVLPRMEFMFLQGGSHFVPPADPEVINRIVEFFDSFETPALP